jgi:hypothetical protein
MTNVGRAALPGRRGIAFEFRGLQSSGPGRPGWLLTRAPTDLDVRISRIGLVIS